MEKIFQFEYNGEKYLAVEVPNGSIHVSIETDHSVLPYGKTLALQNGTFIGVPQFEYISLPYGEWVVVNSLANMSSNQADELVREMIGYYPLSFKSKWFLRDKIYSIGGSEAFDYIILEII